MRLLKPFSLALTLTALTLSASAFAQDATPETTPMMEMTAEATPAMAMTMDMTAEATPMMDMTAEATMSADAMLPVVFPDEIVIPVVGLQPEGIDFDAVRQRFLFGSLSLGTIHYVGASGEPTVFVEDEELSSTVGIQVDAATDRLLVNSSAAEVFSNPSATGMAMLFAYDLETGERLFAADLGALYPDGRHFANDVAVDADGNAYVTDSFSPVIYRVDIDGTATIFAQDERFTGPFLGLNGIDVPAGADYLLVTSGGTLFKIALADAVVTPVELEAPAQIDGMISGADGRVYAVVNGQTDQNIVVFESDDEWESATAVAAVPTNGGATTITIANGEPYYVNAYLNNPASLQNEIVRAVFEE